MLKKLLILASVGETAFGLLLVALPQLAARLLLATDISGGAITAGRLAGACLIALGIGCWPRGDLCREFHVMLAYSALAAFGLVVVGLLRSAGVLLWPAVVVHSAIVLLLWIYGKPRRSA